MHQLHRERGQSPHLAAVREALLNREIRAQGVTVLVHALQNIFLTAGVAVGVFRSELQHSDAPHLAWRLGE